MIAVKLPEGVWSNNYRFPILELIIKKKSDILIVELDLTTIAYASIKAVRLVHEINLHGGILHFFNYKLLIVYAWDAYFVLWSEKKKLSSIARRFKNRWRRRKSRKNFVAERREFKNTIAAYYSSTLPPTGDFYDRLTSSNIRKN